MASVEAGSVPNHYHMHIVGNRLGELAKESIHDIRIHVRCHDRFGLSCLWTDGTDHIQVVVLRLTHGGGSLSAASPQASERALLTEASFVLKEDLQLLRRVQTPQFSELCGEFLF